VCFCISLMVDGMTVDYVNSKYIINCESREGMVN
jgi:hypothetical protein